MKSAPSSLRSEALQFIVLVLGLAVLVRLTVPFVGEASRLLTMLTPAVAVAIMLARRPPSVGIRAAIAGLGFTTGGFRAWPFAIAAPMLIFAVGTVLLASLGLIGIGLPEQSSFLGKSLFKFVVGLGVTTLLALAEEVGWRGYLLPRMIVGNVLRGMLIVGFVQGLWHMPLLLTTSYYHNAGSPWIVAPLFLLTLTLAGVFFGHLRLWTGSIWPAAVAHGAVNSAWAFSSEISQAGSPLVMEYIGGESGVIMIAGLIVIDLVLIGKIRRNGRAGA